MPKKIEKVLGFDYGLRRIGVGVGQTITGTASPVTTILAKDGEPNWDEIKALIKQWRPDVIVVGLPLMMDQSEMPFTNVARKFAVALQSHTEIPVESVDERLSSKEVYSQLTEMQPDKSNSHRRIDAFAACLIIETFLKSLK